MIAFLGLGRSFRDNNPEALLKNAISVERHFSEE
jgi:hypothetical protein